MRAHWEAVLDALCIDVHVCHDLQGEHSVRKVLVDERQGDVNAAVCQPHALLESDLKGGQGGR